MVCTFSIERVTQVVNCLNSVRQQTLKPHQIVLDWTWDLTCHKYRSVFQESKPCRGLSEARNVGVKVAKGDIIVFIDDDATANSHWLSRLVENFHDEKVAGAGGYAKAVWENGRPQWFPEELDWIVGCNYGSGPAEKCHVRKPLGCNMAFRADAFKEVGPFKPDLGRIGDVLIGSEEAEFSIRLAGKIHSATIVFDPSSVVFHTVAKSRCSFRYLLRRSFYEGISKALIGRVQSRSTDTLFVERTYLRYVLRVSIPTRLMRICDWKKLSQFFAILASMLSVITGYFGEIEVAACRSRRTLAWVKSLIYTPLAPTLVYTKEIRGC